MKKTTSAATSSKTQPGKKRPEDALHAKEIVTLFNSGDPGMITVLGKFEVTPMLYELVASQLDIIDKHLIKGVEYTPLELIGDMWWCTFGEDGEREFELCIKHFAAHPDATLIDLKNGMFTRA